MSRNRSEDHLLVRLASYSPRPDRTALEDFSTECLAWLLRHSTQLRQCFLRTFQAGGGNADWTVQTQVPEKAGTDLGRSRFDLVLVNHSGTTALVIECKVDSPVNPGQLDRYRDQAAKRWRTATVGLLARNTGEFSAVDGPRVTWGDIYNLLGRIKTERSEIRFVATQFREFMEQHDMDDPQIDLPKGNLSELQGFLQLADQLEPLAIKVAKTALPKERKAPRKRQFIDDLGGIWIGAYPNLPKHFPLEALWVGFRFSSRGRALKMDAYMEAKVFSAKARAWLKRAKWTEDTGSQFLSNSLTIGSKGILRSKIENWFTDQLKQLLDITSTKAKPRANSKRKPATNAPPRAA
jgi:hypothetical protein